MSEHELFRSYAKPIYRRIQWGLGSKLWCETSLCIHVLCMRAAKALACGSRNKTMNLQNIRVSYDFVVLANHDIFKERENA